MVGVRRELVCTGVGFAALAAIATVPLANVVHPVLPNMDDTEFSVWRLSFIAHQLVSDPAHLFDGNIFYPASRTLANSDAMLGVALIGAPLVWVGVHPVVVHNLLLLGAFATSALAAFALCRALTGDVRASILGGIVFGFAPYRIGHIGHLELQWTPWMPLVLLALHRAIDGQTRHALANGVRAGIFLVLQGLSSLYYLVFFGVYLAGWAAGMAPLTRADRRRPLLATCVVTALSALIVLAPYLMVYASARHTVSTRTPEELQQFSARPSDYLRVSSESETYTGPKGTAEEERSLFPGWIAVMLAAGGVVFSPNRARFVYAALGVWSLDLSLGTNGLTYPVLLRAAPLLWSFRAPARFGVLVLLSIAIVASLGASALFQRLRVRRGANIAAAVLGAACLVEYWSAPLSTRDDPLEPSNVYKWLAGEHGKVIVEFPTPDPAALWGKESWFTYNSIYHWQRLVNGYSAFPPRAYVETMQTIVDKDRPRIAEKLRALGVDYLVLHENLYTPATFEAALSFLANLPGAGPPLSFKDPNDPAVVIPMYSTR